MKRKIAGWKKNLINDMVQKIDIEKRENERLKQQYGQNINNLVKVVETSKTIT